MERSRVGGSLGGDDDEDHNRIIMLGPLVDDIVMGNLNGTSVVIVYRSSRSKRDPKS